MSALKEIPPGNQRGLGIFLPPLAHTGISQRSDRLSDCWVFEEKCRDFIGA